MEKYILGEISSSIGATLYKNPSNQTVLDLILNYIIKMRISKTLRSQFFPYLRIFQSSVAPTDHSTMKNQQISEKFEGKSY